MRETAHSIGKCLFCQIVPRPAAARVFFQTAFVAIIAPFSETRPANLPLLPF